MEILAIYIYLYWQPTKHIDYISYWHINCILTANFKNCLTNFSVKFTACPSATRQYLTVGTARQKYLHWSAMTKLTASKIGGVGRYCGIDSCKALAILQEQYCSPWQYQNRLILLRCLLAIMWKSQARIVSLHFCGIATYTSKGVVYIPSCW